MPGKQVTPVATAQTAISVGFGIISILRDAYIIKAEEERAAREARLRELEQRKAG